MNDQFIRLIDGFTGLYASAESGIYVETGASLAQITFQGVEFVVVLEDSNSGRISIQCNFGVLPQESIGQTLLRLMEVNLHLALSNGGSLGMDGRTREVIFVMRASLCRLTEQSLHAVLAHLVRHVEAWRTTRFEPAGTPPAVPPFSPDLSHTLA